MTAPDEDKTALTDPDNDPVFYFDTGEDDGYAPDEARALLARVVTPVGASTQGVNGG